MSKKSFVLDTNVLLYDPEAVLKFPDREVIIAFSVLEELGALKKYRDELGKNARRALRLLDSIRDIGSGDLHGGVKLENGSSIRIQIESGKNYNEGELSYKGQDRRNKTILIAKSIQMSGGAVCLVSKDFVSRVKAEAAGIEAEDYENFKESFDAVCKPLEVLEVSKDLIDTVYKDGFVKLDKPEEEYSPHDFFLLKAKENSEMLVKYYEKQKKVGPLKHISKPVWGISPLNDEQRCAMEVLLDDSIKLVVLVGQAGTGKTLLAVACGLKKVFDDNVHSKMLVSRPIMPLGKDIGYLPGSKEEKLQSWMQPIHDNLEFLCDTQSEGGSETLQWILESNKIEMEAVTYIRGRTLPKSYVIIDEAQNLTGHEIKTIISRAGKNTKVILTGDPTQIDNPYLDRDSNGITLTVAKFKAHSIFAYVYLTHTERSELAALAANLM
ncbi:Uncharacterized protein YlaK [Chlamydiales bacterium SCGC AB-751-O23]|nr:Uncharacterized protein YlaK [Chlamydiales bacterium SCGC AB-751-O23]